MKAVTRTQKMRKCYVLHNEILEEIERFFGDELFQGDVRSTVGAEGGEDIPLTSHGRDILQGISIEAKNQELWKLPEWIEQAETNATKVGAEVPVLIVRKDKIKPRVLLPLRHFMVLLKRSFILRRFRMTKTDEILNKLADFCREKDVSREFEKQLKDLIKQALETATK